MRIGIGYCGSAPNSVSTSNQEIVERPVNINWTEFSFYKFSIYNQEACSVKINNSSPIALMAAQGFTCDPNTGDAPISSFVIVDSGVHYNFIAAY